MAPTNALKADAIDRVRILGSKLTIDLRDALTAAKISLATDQTTQLDLTFVDTGWSALTNGAGVIGTRVDFDDFALQIAAVEAKDVNGTEGFTLSCRPIVIANLKNRRGAKVMSNVSPTDFVRSEAKAAGITSMVLQTSAKRKQIARDVPQKGQQYDNTNYPSSWTTFQRLAQELGYLVFEAANTLYFGKPSWLVNNSGQPQLSASYKGSNEATNVNSVPDCRKSIDSKYTTIDFNISALEGFYWIPGRRVSFGGVPGFGGGYLLAQTSYDLLAPEGLADVSIETPIDPEPQPPTTASTSSGSGSGSGSTSTTKRNTKSAADFVYWAQKQLGDRYVYGAAVSSSTNPTQFDCSSLVKWAAAMVGVYMPRTSSEQIDYCTSHHTRISVSEAARTRGALLHHSGHSAISLGNGRTIEAANSRVGVVNSSIGNRFSAAGKLPTMKY